MSLSKEIILVNVNLRKGDHDSFVEVYNLYNKELYHFIKKFIWDSDQINDILNEVFLNLWKYRERINVTLPLRHYLYKIARNMVYKVLKKELKLMGLLEDIRWMKEKEIQPSSIENKLHEDELNIIYDLAVNQLPPQRKRIFKMSREEGLSYKEIGEYLNISPNTVKEHMSLAMKTMQDYIAKDHGIVLSTLICLLLFQ